MAVALVQETTANSGASSTTLTCTLPVAPTANNLLVFAMAGDKNTGALTLAGFTQLYTLTSSSVTLYVWYKVSAGTETSISPSWANSSNSGNMSWYAEYQDSLVTGTSWTVAGQASNITDETTVMSKTTGTTSSTTVDGLGIAFAAVDSIGNVSSVNAWANSYAARYSPAGGGGRGAIFVATKAETAGTAASSTFSYSGTADQVSAAIGVFAKVASGVPATVATGTGAANDVTVALVGTVQPGAATGTGAALDASVIFPVVAGSRQSTKAVTQYVIYARNASLQREGIIEDYQVANFKLRHNDVGTWELTVNRARKEAVWLSNPGWGIEAVSILPDGTKVPLIAGPMSTRKHSKSADHNTLTVTGYSDDILLSRAVAHPCPTNSFPPYSAQASSGWVGTASGVLRQYVHENIGLGAILPRRVPNLVLGADPGVGSSITAYARWDNLLVFLQGLANAGGGIGFRIRQVESELEFQTFMPVDHSGDVTLSELLGNLQAWEYVSESPESTYLFIGGSGEGTARLIAELPDTNAIIQWGRREHFVDKRDSGVNADLIQAGTQYQIEHAEKAGLTITPVDTASCIYGKHYNLGDTVSIQVEGPSVPLTDIVREVDISLTPNGPQTIKPIIGTPNSNLIFRLFRKYRETQARISNLERR